MKKRLLLILSWATLLVPASAQHQLPNPGFEQWDGGNTSEPTHWNSFATSDGSWASLASSPHHYRRNGGRPGTTGNHYLTIYAKSIMGIVANGNMTTGRVHAGSLSASSSDNFNYTQRSNANHSQPFSGTPDSMYVWVSYYARSASSRGQVSAILHGDSDFRAPNQENRTDLYCGKAQVQFTRTTSSASTPQWEQLRVPFIYDGQSDARYLLLNLTTNASPGSGSANDSLSIDDIEFIYSAWITGILVDGQSIAGFRKGQLDYTVHVDDPAQLTSAVIIAFTEVADATVSTTLLPVDDTSSIATITVTAEDSITRRIYRLTLTTGYPAGASTLAIPNAPEPRLQIYPNPTSSHITINAHGPFLLTDLLGRPLCPPVLLQSDGFTLDLSSLPSGIYLLRCNGAIQRIVKQ